MELTMLGDLSLYGWLAGIVGALVAAFALKSRGQYKDKASKAESRTEAVIEKRKTEHEVEKLDDAGVASKFDWLQSVREKRR